MKFFPEFIILFSDVILPFEYANSGDGVKLSSSSKICSFIPSKTVCVDVKIIFASALLYFKTFFVYPK